MISLAIIFCLCFLPNVIYTSVLFTLNPDCNLPECKEPNHPALYYAKHNIGDNRIHIIYSTIGDLTISILQTGKNDAPIFNYSALFSQNFVDAIKFPDTTPINSQSLVLRRIIEFNDVNDTGKLQPKNQSRISYFLPNISATNVTLFNNNTEQPTFQLLLPTLNGSLNIDIIFPGVKEREKKFPKLATTPKSFYLNIALSVQNTTFPKSRFAYEFYLMLPGVGGSKLFSTRYIDDQYTPGIASGSCEKGIFNIWRLQAINSLYPCAMLWKPVVYQSEERSIEKNTLMRVYDINNNISLDPKLDQGIYYSILKSPSVSGFNVSLGQAKDGFFVKSNYAFVQFTVGLDFLEADSTTLFVSVALIVSLALPCIVAITAIIIMIRRKFANRLASSYDPIDD